MALCGHAGKRTRRWSVFFFFGGRLVGWIWGGLAGGGAVLRAVYRDSYHPCLRFLNLVRASVFNTLRNSVKAGDLTSCRAECDLLSLL